MTKIITPGPRGSYIIETVDEFLNRVGWQLMAVVVLGVFSLLYWIIVHGIILIKNILSIGTLAWGPGLYISNIIDFYDGPYCGYYSNYERFPNNMDRKLLPVPVYNSPIEVSPRSKGIDFGTVKRPDLSSFFGTVKRSDLSSFNYRGESGVRYIKETPLFLESYKESIVGYLTPPVILKEHGHVDREYLTQTETDNNSQVYQWTAISYYDQDKLVKGYILEADKHVEPDTQGGWHQMEPGTIPEYRDSNSPYSAIVADNELYEIIRGNRFDAIIDDQCKLDIVER